MIGHNEERRNNREHDRIILLQGAPPPLDMEFEPGVLSTVFQDAGLSVGRCFGSKSTYRELNPRSFFIPNANIFCRPHGKVWWGDLDLRSDQPVLEKLAYRLRCRLYVVRECDGRFENANASHDRVTHYAAWHTGGATRVRAVSRFLRRSGLGLTNLCLVTNVRRSRLTKYQPPDIALAVYRRLADFDEFFGQIAAEAGHRRWGDWWTTANEKLNGETPMSVLKSGQMLPLGQLIKDEHLLRCFGLVLSWSKRL